MGFLSFLRRPEQPKTALSVVAPQEVVPFSRLTSSLMQSGRYTFDRVRENIKTVIDMGVTFEGNLVTDSGLIVDGKIVGDVLFGRSHGLMIIRGTGVIEGNVSGPGLFVNGRVIGDIHCPGLLVLTNNSVVTGNITCARMIVYKGAKYSGKVNINPHLLG